MRIYFLAAFLMAFSYCSGQFNDSTNHHIRYSATGIANKTKETRSFFINNSFLFNVRKRKLELNSLNSWVYGEQNNAKTNNDFSSVLNLDVLKNIQRLYYWGLLTYTKSYSLKIYEQFQGGAGLGYTLFKGPEFYFVISDGILFETSDLEVPGLGRDRYETVRNSLRVKYKLQLGSTVTLEGATYWQPSLSSASDYILQSNTALAIRLKKWLSLSSGVLYNRYSRTDRENLLVNFGFIIDSYF